MILIQNATIVTQDRSRRIITDGSILIEGNRIKAIGQTPEIKNKYYFKNKKIKKLSGKDKVVMPGLINTHTHLAMTLLRGLADDLPLEEWWLEKIFPKEAKLTREDIYLGTLLGGLEMIKSGTTYFADFYFFADEIAKAVKNLGLRANIGFPVMDLPTPEFKNAEELLASVPMLLKSWREEKRIKFSLAPHMLQTTSLETYQHAKKLADKYKLLLQTHLAETENEVKRAIKRYRQTPAQLLIKNKILDKKSIAAHACHLTGQEIKLLAKHKVNVSHCPISNMKLASGLMPLVKMLKAGINITLGTDGASSNNNLDLFEEMKLTALKHKLAEKDPGVAEAQTVLDMTTINAARALGEEKNLGSIEKEKKADIIILDFNQPHLTPCYNPVSHLVYAAGGSDVETVIIDGKIVMEKGKILTVDENEILKNVKREFSHYE